MDNFYYIGEPFNGQEIHLKDIEKQFPDLEEDEKNRSFLLGELFLTGRCWGKPFPDETDISLAGLPAPLFYTFFEKIYQNL